MSDTRGYSQAAVQSTVQQRDMFRILLSQAETQLQEAKGTLSQHPTPTMIHHTQPFTL